MTNAFIKEHPKPKTVAKERRIVVLDDDPTGTQTVYDIPVVTVWDTNTLERMLISSRKAFYILTNTRSFSVDEAIAINREIAENLCEASIRSGIDFELVSRGDSTLRGHFPEEVDALKEVVKKKQGFKIKGYIIVPFFLEGGRVTINNVHYVKEEGRLIPVGETEFAKDKAFGFQSSNLIDWVVEKTKGFYQPKDIIAVSLEDIRSNPARVIKLLSTITDFAPVIVNVETYDDLKLFNNVLEQVDALGIRFIYRTAASFVKVRCGLNDKPYLSAPDFKTGTEKKIKSGGLVIVGSHIKKSSQQLEILLTMPGIVGVELEVSKVLQEISRQGEIDRVKKTVNELLSQGKDTVVYTSRFLESVATAVGNLQISQSVSQALIEVVRGLENEPRFLVAKGGITSSDVAKYGLEIKEALVLGQILPGVPVWKAGLNSRFPGMKYIIFPGNVGTTDSLKRVVEIINGVSLGE